MAGGNDFCWLTEFSPKSMKVVKGRRKALSTSLEVLSRMQALIVREERTTADNGVPMSWALDSFECTFKYISVGK